MPMGASKLLGAAEKSPGWGEEGLEDEAQTWGAMGAQKWGDRSSQMSGGPWLLVCTEGAPQMLIGSLCDWAGLGY